MLLEAGARRTERTETNKDIDRMREEERGREKEREKEERKRENEREREKEGEREKAEQWVKAVLLRTRGRRRWLGNRNSW